MLLANGLTTPLPGLTSLAIGEGSGYNQTAVKIAPQCVGEGYSSKNQSFGFAESTASCRVFWLIE